ncbi:MAG: TonB-dependent receptor [Bryobacterales bacterium]|nr:TonB-dependent receptor [Bryobacterales bacterium]
MFANTPRSVSTAGMAVVLILSTLSLLTAQEALRTATLQGVVLDASGATVANARVTAVNTATKFISSGVTNEVGRYYLPYLTPGSYELKVEVSGFRPYTRTGLDLRAGESPRIDVNLEVGAVSESVTVTGAAPLLETETSLSSASLGNQVVMRLPVQQMRTFNIMIYMPGVANTGWNTFNAIGQRQRSMGYQVDGVSAKEPVMGDPAHYTRTVQTTTDAIAEVRVLTTGLPAEYGRGSSGMLVAVMKSGTNDLHGSAEDRYLNRKLLHRTYFDVAKSKAAFGYHELAGTVGGPIVLPRLYNGRDKTFFFFGWQRHHEKSTENTLNDTPSREMLNGDLSFGGKAYPIFDPLSTRQVDGKWIRDPIPNNLIPPSRFDPVARNFLAQQPFEEPNAPGFYDSAGPHQNLVADSTNRSYRSRWDLKIDHQISPAHKIFGRYSHNRHRHYAKRYEYTRLAWDSLIPDAQPHPEDMDNIAFSDTYTINPTTINEFRLGMNRYTASRSPDTYMGGWAQKLGIPNTLPDTFPEFTNTGYTVFMGGFWQSVAEDFTISENLTRVSGQHTFKMGWEVLRSRYNRRDEDRASGTYNMGGTDMPFTPRTGVPFAGFLLGSVTSASFTQTRAAWLPRWWTHGIYFQDDWKVARGLTLNLGLRWTYETPYNTKYGQQAQFDPGATDPVTGLKGAITHPKGPLARRDLNNFQPRMGMAWNFAKNWAFRGSLGMATSDIMSPATNIMFEEYFASANVQSPPGDPRIAFRLSEGPPRIQYTINPDGTVPFVGTNYSGRRASWFDPNMRMPYILMWSGALQWQFTQTWLAEANYQGSSGVGLLNRWDMNAIPLNVSTDLAVLNQIYTATQNYKPYRQFGELRHYSNYGHSSYHGVTFRTEKRYSHGLNLNAFYTWSKALDDVDGEDAASGITFYNRRLEKGPASYDLTHRVVTITTYDLPFGSGRRFLNKGGVSNAVLGGWQLTWSNTWQSGYRNTVGFGGSPNRYLPGAARPNITVSSFKDAVTPGWNIGPNRFPTAAQNPYLKASAFSYPAAFTPGSLGRNTFQGPAMYWPQASLGKQWRFRERASFTLRWDINDIFKTVQYPRRNWSFNQSQLEQFGKFTAEEGNFSGMGGAFHSIIVLRLEF